MDARPGWTPLADQPFRQETGLRVATDQPVTAAAHAGEMVFAVVGGALHRLDGDRLEPVDGPAGVSGLCVVDGALWAYGAGGLFRMDGGAWQQALDRPVAAIAHFNGAVHAACGRNVWRVAEGAAEAVATNAPGEIIALTAYSETLYALTPRELCFVDGGRFECEHVIDWGRLPGTVCRGMARLSSRLFIATDRGLAVYRGMAVTVLDGAAGLPVEDVTCLAAAPDGALWLGTTGGAIRYEDGRFDFFGADRWLPDNRVLSIAADEGGATIGTAGGLAEIRYASWRLSDKAAYYERHLEAWGQKRLGFTHKLEWDDALGRWVREVSDNDGGYSAHYLAAQCFRYAVTGEEAARQEAAQTFRALKWCEEITPIDGFPARSIWVAGETGHRAEHGSGGLPAEWHETDDGRYMWKGDTSSDEVDAHFYGTVLFHDLAANEDEQAAAVEHIDRMAAHIVDNGWLLRDLDGEPTRWGRWDPAYFNSYHGHHARGLNGLEVLSFMTTAHAVTGKDRYRQARDELIGLGYLDEVVRQKLVFPPQWICHFDDRLAFLSYFTLVRYETDPYLRSVYARSLERTWATRRIQQLPWFNLLYGAMTGNDCELEQAIEHLREWPLDLIRYRWDHRHRRDLRTPEGYEAYAGGPRPFSPREIGPMRWDATSLALTGGTNREVVDPAGWLEAYWMARWLGMVLEENDA